MAPSNGNSTTYTGARKRLIQPVLPALPLPSKVNKQAPKVQDEEKLIDHGANGIKTEDQIVTDTNKLHSPEPEESSGAISKTEDIQQVYIESDGATGQDCAVQASSSKKDVPKSSTALDPTNHTEDAEASMDGKRQALATARSPVLETDYSTQEASTTNQITISEGENEKEAINGARTIHNHDEDRSEVAPEVITSFGEVSPLSRQSRNPSVSVSGPHTPSRAIPVSMPPEAVHATEDTGSNPGRDHVPTGFVPNGNTNPMKSVTLPSAGVISPPIPKTFPTVLSHINTLEHTHDWADCEIQVLLPNAAGPALIRPGHSIILLRSPRLRNILYAQRAQQYFFYLITLFPARVIDPNAFDAALRFLYTDTILSADRLLPQHSLLDQHSKIRALDYILSYMSAGLELGIDPVVTRAFELLGRIIDWDVAETIVKEAVALRTVAIAIPNSPPESRTAAASLLQCVFNLFIFQLDITQFQLDNEATPSYMTSRLAPFETGRAAVNPALATMVFGSMPASAADSPASPSNSSAEASSSPISTASTILLNLNFDNLCVLARGLQKTYGAEGIRVIRDAVSERERRRLHVFENKSFSNKERTANQNLWDVIGWREYMADNHLQRDRVGFILSNNKRGTYI